MHYQILQYIYIYNNFKVDASVNIQRLLNRVTLQVTKLVHLDLPIAGICHSISSNSNAIEQWYSTWVRLPPGVREDILGGT
jgi:hypothetical protein